MRKCERCEKSYNLGQKRKKLRGQYNPVKRHHKQKANLHKTRLYKPGKVSMVCTKCLKTLTKKYTKTVK